jgi:hypothetical protein
MNLGGMNSFIFGKGTDSPTYESLRRKREIADLLKQQSTARTPQNMWEGIDAVGKALISTLADKKLKPQEDAERQRISDILGGLGSGSTVMGMPAGAIGGAQDGFTGAGFGGGGASASGQPTGSYRDAIAGIESKGSGDYAAIGPDVNGDRAYGKYQVMGNNIPEWTQEALGQQMSPEQFLASPEAQDAVFDHKFGGYAQKYGPEGAAKAWFSGEGGMNNPNASDGNLTNSQYAAKFMDGMGGNPGMDMMGMAGMGQPDMSKLQQLADVVGNPYASEGQKMVAQALIQREMGRGDGGDTLGWSRLMLDRDKFNFDKEEGTRQGVQSFGNVYYAKRDDPNTPEVDPKIAPYVTDKAGNVKWLDTGGAEALPPVTWQDIGTARIPTGPGAERIGEPLAVDNAGKAAQTELGQASGKAAAGLGDKGVMVDAAIAQIDRIVSDPVLPEVLGNIQGRMAPRTQAQANAQAEIDGLGGKVFANAISALVGLGAMSNMEGQAASQSLANLAQIQDETQFAAELNRLKTLLTDKLEAAKRLAAQGGGVQPGVTEDGYRFLGGDPADPNSWERVR